MQPQKHVHTQYVGKHNLIHREDRERETVSNERVNEEGQRDRTGPGNAKRSLVSSTSFRSPGDVTHSSSSLSLTPPSATSLPSWWHSIVPKSSLMDPVPAATPISRCQPRGGWTRRRSEKATPPGGWAPSSADTELSGCVCTSLQLRADHLHFHPSSLVSSPLSSSWPSLLLPSRGYGGRNGARRKWRGWRLRSWGELRTASSRTLMTCRNRLHYPGTCLHNPMASKLFFRAHLTVIRCFLTAHSAETWIFWKKNLEKSDKIGNQVWT